MGGGGGNTLTLGLGMFKIRFYKSLKALFDTLWLGNILAEIVDGAFGMMHDDTIFR